MSDELDKEKRQRRFQQKNRHVKRQVSIAKSHKVDVREPHRFQDCTSMTCGSSKCRMCGNPRKMWDELNMQERSFEQDI